MEIQFRDSDNQYLLVHKGETLLTAEKVEHLYDTVILMLSAFSKPVSISATTAAETQAALDILNATGHIKD